jgi:hypothetical protein
MYSQRFVVKKKSGDIGLNFNYMLKVYCDEQTERNKAIMFYVLP